MTDRPTIRAGQDRVSERAAPGSRRLAVLCLVACAGLAVWIVVLGHLLGSTVTVRRWDVSWVGLDVGEELALLLMAVSLWRNGPRVGFYAAIAGTLFLVDGWFDAATARAGVDYATSLLLAVGLELPIAAGCLAIAWRGSGRRPGS